MLPGRRGTAYEGCVCSGYARAKETCYPTCPECGASVSEFYKNRDGDVVGCENCVSSVNAWEVSENAL